MGLPAGGRGKSYPPNTPIPTELDWDMWLGPAPYCKFMGVYDWDWRWVLDWGGGQMMDWIGHHAAASAMLGRTQRDPWTLT